MSYYSYEPANSYTSPSVPPLSNTVYIPTAEVIDPGIIISIIIIIFKLYFFNIKTIKLIKFNINNYEKKPKKNKYNQIM